MATPIARTTSLKPLKYATISYPMILVLLLILSGLSAMVFWGEHRYRQGRAEVYKAYDHGSTFVGDNALFLKGDPSKGVADIRLSFGLFRRPIIENGQVTGFRDTYQTPRSLEDEDEIPLPKPPE